MKEKYSRYFRKIAPDVMGTIREISVATSDFGCGTGRARTLATLSGLSERVVRAHVDVLRRSGLVRLRPWALRWNRKESGSCRNYWNAFASQ